MSKDRLAAVLEEARKEFGKIKTLKTKLTQEKNISLFAVPVVSQGLFLFKTPDKIRFEFLTPFQSALIVNQKRISKYEMVNGQWKRLGQGDQRIAGIILEHMAAWMKGDFNHGNLYRVSGKHTPGTTPEHPGAVTLILTPKAEEFRAFIRAFELGINKDLNRLDYIVIREKDEDFTKIAFLDDRINRPLDDLFFTGTDLGPVSVPPW
ncbi:MAG: outer membrane lipoprotein carrier protein LolA [Desulfobacterales bacterium]|nr:outer membrane lipoprotein carrier protein LolA [Desulfobacterales bacterium]